MWFIRIAAFVQTISDILGRCCRTRRSMHLLTNGHWIDATVSVPADQIDMKYDAESHTLLDQRNELCKNTVRWPWLSVIADETVDISDFFSSLRITTGCTVPGPTIFMLYAHQHCTLYTRGIHIMGRDCSFIDGR